MSRLTVEEKKEKYPTAVYTRIVGYLSDTSHWHDAKKEEFKDREEYTPPAGGNK